MIHIAEGQFKDEYRRTLLLRGVNLGGSSKVPYGPNAAATMFTLFFGGNDLAPRTQVDGEPVQEYLQRHYIGAMKQVAGRLKDLPNVVGYDTLNEPSNGYIGCADLNSNAGGLLRLGDSPTPLQGMWLGGGIPQDVEVWDLRVSGASLRVLEANLLSYTLWNYTADNSNDRGDQWNDEDLSIYSPDQRRDPSNIHYQYPDGCAVEVSDGTYELDQAKQLLLYHCSAEREVHSVRVTPLRRSG